MKRIYLAATHTKDGSLSELVDEIQAIEAILRPLHERKLWQLETNRAAYLTDIFRIFSLRTDPIAIFHYAGHADQYELRFEDGGHVRGLAELFQLDQSSNLQMVFLNGCSSAGLVDKLHGAGINVVIATTRPVGDVFARLFAVKFYETWVMQDQSLEQAFVTATAWIHAQSNGYDQRVVLEKRGVGRAAGYSSAVLPWGLYLNPNITDQQQRELLQWGLSDLPSPPVHPLHVFPKGPRVTPEIISLKLKEAYADIFKKPTDAENIVMEAVELRKSADPNNTQATHIRLVHLRPPESVSPLVYWTDVFYEACLHGPKMLAALLLIVSDDPFPRHIIEERKNLLEKLKHWA